ncbi:Putative cytochrome [Salmonella enterica subsp. enterica serovar Rubislaw str. A4-653]|uniref:Putative cytochrome n=1 Tax=Salmonella enterica subsp. enterica serovar Rubislaw str. A4-653 TaxID=913081 RepID=G5QK31_SALRU|nr:Putative cytochrome [Salmonella enterica subsp. enterica serovar Rubislaw str. A4-653]
MAHFSRLQITLHWLTLLLTGIAYAAIELRGWATKGSSVYLFMKDMHYDMGVLVWALMFLRLYLKHKYPDPIRSLRLPLLTRIRSLRLPLLTGST